MLDLDEETLAALGYGDLHEQVSKPAISKYNLAHIEAQKRYRASHRAEEAKRLRDRYWSDPEFRERRKEQAKLCNRKRRLSASTLKPSSSNPAT